MAQNDEGQGSRPRLRLIRGNATPEEIAAVVALLTARAAPVERPADTRPADTERSAWARPAQAMRAPLATGAGAWRRSGLTPGVRTRADW